jgi:hypothetical protein
MFHFLPNEVLEISEVMIVIEEGGVFVVLLSQMYDRNYTLSARK